jgi:hypothetical protein
MKTFIAGLALASLLAFPAFGQSYDPDLGTGNIVSWSEVQQAPGQSSRVVPSGTGAATSAYGAVTPFGTPGHGQNSRAQSNTGREQALRECSAAAAPYKSTTWGHMEIHQYRTCMEVHGQAE